MRKAQIERNTKAKDDAALLSDVRILGNSALRSELLEILEDLDYTP